MKKVLITMAALSALSAGAPAAAQIAGGVRAQLQQLDLRLQAGLRSGAITRREAVPLRGQFDQMARLERLYSRDGLSGRERADLEQRIQVLRRAIRFAERGADNRYDRNADGRDDRYDRNRDGYDDRFDRDRDGDDDRFDRNNDNRDDRFDRNRDGDDDRFDRDNDGDDDRFDRDDDDVDDRAERLDRNRDGWDDRDIDRDGRWDDDATEGRYRDGGRPPIGAILGVGQRAPADLGALPLQYRDTYRDGNGSYYRSDGRAIYQIDVRTNAVVRVYPIDR